MSRRMTPMAATFGVAVATLTSALALDEPAARPQATAPTKAEARPDPPKVTAPGGKTAVKALQVAPAPAAKARAVQKPAVAKIQAEAEAMLVAGGFNFEGQLQQFRPALRAEFHIVRVVCHPTPEQLKAIARDGERALREAAKTYVEGMRRPMTVTQRAALEPRHQIREGLARSVKAHLSGEAVDRYQREIERREANKKQLAVRNLVARMDRDLVLTREQREKVEESLTAHWQDSWCQSIEMFMHDNNYLPLIPDHLVVPYLNDAQKTVWWGTQKTMSYWSGLGMMGGVMVNDPLEDEELRVARLEAAKDDPKPDPNQPGPGMRGRAFQVAAPPAAVVEQVQVEVLAQPDVPRKSAEAAKGKAATKK